MSSSDIEGASESKLELLQSNLGDFIEKVQLENTGCPIVFVTKENIFAFLEAVRKKEWLEYNFLSDLTAYDDNPPKDKVPDYGLGRTVFLEEAKRFFVVYHLLSLNDKDRLCIKVPLEEGEEIPSVCSLWKAANWLEREVWDLYGIKFSGHPDLRRIMLDERWEGHPFRKDYPIKRYQRFEDSLEMASAGLEERGMTLDKENGNSPEATVDSFEEESEIFESSKININIGPQHPAMHGTLRVMARIKGETIEESICELGFLHRAIEKIGEVRTYHQFIPFTDRLNYCSALQNNVAYVTSVEKLLSIELTPRNTWIRMMCCEMARIIDHLICVGINAFDLGAMTFFLYGFHQRERCYDLIEKLCGSRLTTTYTRVGGLMQDVPDGFLGELDEWLDEFSEVLEEMDQLLTGNRIWVDRTKGVGSLSREDALSYSVTGPCLRASNVNFDLRRDAPYLAYDEVEFDVPISREGDVLSRYLIRMKEMRESVRILRQIVQKMPGGPIWSDDTRVVIPEKERVYNSMEAMIHHFKFFMEGFDVPEGEAYCPMEGPNGEVGFYIVSKGGPKAYRLRIRAPSFFMFQIVPETSRGYKIADLVAIIGSVNIIAGELDR